MEDWVTCISLEDNFKIEFPSRYSQEHMTYFPNSNPRRGTWIYKTSLIDFRQFLISVTHLETYFGSEEDILNAALDMLISDARAKVLGRKNSTKIAGLTSIEYKLQKLTHETPVEIKGIVTISGNIVYVLSMISPENEQKDYNSFINSFRIINQSL